MQTTYTDQAPEGVLGLMTEDWDRYVDTVIPQAAVKVGRLLTADTTVGKVRNAAKLPAAAGDITIPGAMGITIYDQTREGGSDWPANRPTPVLRRGRIWVFAHSPMTRWTHPFVVFAGTDQVGGFRGDADGTNAAALTQAIVLTDSMGGGLVLIEISLH